MQYSEYLQKGEYLLMPSKDYQNVMLLSLLNIRRDVMTKSKIYFDF